MTRRTRKRITAARLEQAINEVVRLYALDVRREGKRGVGR
jgi:hypothetical protein